CLVLYQLYEQVFYSRLSHAFICLERADVLENQNPLSVESACFSVADVTRTADSGVYYLDCREYQYLLPDLALSKPNSAMAYGGMGQTGLLVFIVIAESGVGTENLGTA